MLYIRALAIATMLLNVCLAVDTNMNSDSNIANSTVTTNTSDTHCPARLQELELEAFSLQRYIAYLNADLYTKQHTLAASEQKIGTLQRALQEAKKLFGYSAGVEDGTESEGRHGFKQGQAPPPYQAHTASLRRSIAAFLQQERERYRRNDLSDAEEAKAGPKEISIWCEAAPRVNILPLDDESRDMGACLSLAIGAPELDARLVLQCDGSFAPERDERTGADDSHTANGD